MMRDWSVRTGGAAPLYTDGLGSVPTTLETMQSPLFDPFGTERRFPFQSPYFELERSGPPSLDLD
jgi:hypothetical protein